MTSFFGSPAINYLDGELREKGGRLAILVEGAEFPLPEGVAERLKEKAAPRRLKLGVRPEHLGLKAGESSAPIAAEIELIETLGSEIPRFHEARP